MPVVPIWSGRRVFDQHGRQSGQLGQRPMAFAGPPDARPSIRRPPVVAAATSSAGPTHSSGFGPANADQEAGRVVLDDRIVLLRAESSGRAS